MGHAPRSEDNASTLYCLRLSFVSWPVSSRKDSFAAHNKKDLMRFSALLLSSISLVPLQAQQTLDPTFGTDGVVNTALDPGYDGAYAMALQTDGKIVITGPSGTPGSLNVLVARYSTDGLLDAGFGTNGVAIFNINGDDYGYAIALQDDGKVLVAGSTKTGTNNDMLVLRLLSDGMPDTSFGPAGVVTLDGGSTNDKVNAIAVRPDGHIVIGGNATTAGKECFYLAQINADGTLDDSFGTSGEVKHLVGTDNCQLNALSLLDDGRIVAAGSSFATATQYDFAVCRYMADGSFDTSFNTTGKAVIAASTTNDNGYGVAVQTDGDIVVGGVQNSTSTSAAIVTLARSNADGTLDDAFGTDGLAHLFTGGNPTRAAQVIIQPDGAILACGTASPAANERDSYLCRLTSDGVADASFGVNGELIFGEVNLYRETPCMVLQPDGKVIVGGIDAGGGVVNTLLLRYGSAMTTSISERSTPEGITIRSARPDGLLFDLPYAASEVEVIDANGRLLQRSEGSFASGHNTLRFRNNMPSGTYLLRAVTGEGTMMVRFAVVR